MTSPRTRRLAVLASGQGTNLRALLDAGVRAIGQDGHVRAAEAAWLARLAEADVDTILLAGFMRILDGRFLAAYPGRILNIHPSLLPAFPGTHSIARALEHGVRVTGCTVHLVDAGVDEGPILEQAAIAIHVDDTLESLTTRMHAAEHALYARAVRAFLTRPFTLLGRRVIWQ